MTIEEVSALALVLAVFIGCCVVVIHRLVIRRNELASEGQENPLNQSLYDKTLQMLAVPFESCLISAKDIEEAINVCVNPLRNLEANMDYTSKKDWAKPIGVMCDFNLSVKELLLYSMNLADPRSAIDLLAGILEINVPLDALNTMQDQGKKPFPKYRGGSLMLWLGMRKELDDVLLMMKKTYGLQNKSDRSPLSDLVILIMKTLYIPVEASGLAIVFGLVFARIELDYLSSDI